MSQTFRQPEILDIARREGKVTVQGLADRFGVTLQTIRRDLTELAEAGRLERVHGGAVLPSGTVNIGYEDRRALNADAKTRIARTVAAMLPDGASIFLNIGTTTEAVAQALLGHRGLLVVTNNLNVAQTLTANRDCEVVMTGGGLRAADGGLVGPLAVDSVSRFRVDHAVIGCSALDPGGDILDFDMDEIVVTQAILHRARNTVLVADGSKFTRSAPARVAALSEIDGIVTDRPLPEPLTLACRDLGVGVTIAAP